MNKAYYLYRPHCYFDEFYPGKVLNLITDNNLFGEYLRQPDQICLAKEYFPSGLSPHGLSMLLSFNKCDDRFTQTVMELIFELVRQLHFPHAPSRFTSLYASESIADAEKWYRILQNNFGYEYGQVAQSLWEIEYDTSAEKFDVSYLDEITSEDKFSHIIALKNAHNYWNKNMGKNPLPELLIPYPVTVVRMVRIYDFTKP